MADLRSLQLDRNLVKDSSTSGAGYSLNRDAYPVLRKVEGEPGIAKKPGLGADAAREAFAALQIASRPDVDKVYIGDEAYSYIHKHGGDRDKNCDVVGVLSGNRGVFLGEGKGKNVVQSLHQLSVSASALSGSGASGRVQGVLVVARPPLYLTCENGLTLSEARDNWKLSQPGLDHLHRGALEAAKELGLNPRYDYLLDQNEPFGYGPLTGIGLAVPKQGDGFLYTNKVWLGDSFLPSWGPIRKLVLPHADAGGVGINFVRD